MVIIETHRNEESYSWEFILRKIETSDMTFMKSDYA